MKQRLLLQKRVSCIHKWWWYRTRSHIELINGMMAGLNRSGGSNGSTSKIHAAISLPGYPFPFQSYRFRDRPLCRRRWRCCRLTPRYSALLTPTWARPCIWSPCWWSSVLALCRDIWILNMPERMGRLCVIIMDIMYIFLVGWLFFTPHRHRGHLETAPPFTVPCGGREAR